VSLYGKADAKQASARQSLIPPPGIPAWLLAIAGYLALMTVINNAFELTDYWIGVGRLGLEHIDYLHIFLDPITGLLSVVVLLLFVFRSYTLCIYYLVAVATLQLALEIADMAGQSEILPRFLYSLQGLDSVPKRIVAWTIDWRNISDDLKQVVHVVGPIVSLTVCGLLLYFHAKRSPTFQR